MRITRYVLFRAALPSSAVPPSVDPPSIYRSSPRISSLFSSFPLRLPACLPAPRPHAFRVSPCLFVGPLNLYTRMRAPSRPKASYSIVLPFVQITPSPRSLPSLQSRSSEQRASSCWLRIACHCKQASRRPAMGRVSCTALVRQCYILREPSRVLLSLSLDNLITVFPQFGFPSSSITSL